MSEAKECQGLLPCPFCGGDPTWIHHSNYFDGARQMSLGCCEFRKVGSEADLIAAWNRRAAKPAAPAPLPSQQNVRELAEEYCDVREEYERDREWRFNYSGLQNFAVALLSAAPTPPETAKEACWCHRCHEGKPRVQMILCPSCGNKRCPHASDHALICTGSNAQGQPGSIYGKPERCPPETT